MGLHIEHPPTAATPLSLIRCIHSASINAAEWPRVLESMRHRLDASVVTLGYHEFASGTDAAWIESPEGADFGAGLATYAARNPWFLSTGDYIQGRVMTDDELISPRDLRRTDFYRGFLQPRGLLHRLCGVVAQRGSGVHLLSAYRSESRGAFGNSEKSELEILLAHVTLSLQNQWRWQEADDFAHALLTQFALDANPQLLLTAEGVPVYRNPAADRLLVEKTGLRLGDMRLAAASRADQRLLDETIARIAQSPPGDPAASSSVVTLACVPPAPPLVVVVRAAGRVFSRDSGLQRGVVLVTVRGGHARHDHATCVFARQYELTAAQAKVSALMLVGQPLPKIAKALNVSENTVRSHLRQIFQKTETHGQMELVHLHARVCPALA
jgi:DNA-binding CsgD family transcriptional regulator